MTIEIMPVIPRDPAVGGLRSGIYQENANSFVDSGTS